MPELTPPPGYKFNPVLCRVHGPQEPGHRCSALPYPVEYVLACVATRPHADGRWNITDATGCPRRGRLEEEGAAIDITRKRALIWGSALHGVLEKWAEAAGEAHRAENRLAGELFGLPVSGRLDKLEADGYVVDYKTGNESSHLVKTGQRNSWGSKQRVDETPVAEHVWQVEVERYLLEQNGVATAGGRIYYMANVPGKYDDCVMKQWAGPVWSESRLADFRPLDGAWTAKQLAQMAAARRPLDQMPLVGASVRFGKDKTMCDYCAVQAACNEAPVPDLEGVF